MTPGMNSKNTKSPGVPQTTEDSKILRHFPAYGTVSENSTSDTCPTCRGTGRIPRGWLSFCHKSFECPFFMIVTVFLTASETTMHFNLQASCLSEDLCSRGSAVFSHTLLSHPFYGMVFFTLSLGHEDQLVAVIPCNDVRLRPRRT